MALYFIRHGESVSNERNLFAGLVDTPLTALGFRQARAALSLIERQGLVFDEIHCSPLVRAFETASLIAKGSAKPATDAPLVVTDALLERDFGKLSEQNKGLIKKYYGAKAFEHMFHSAHGAPPDGESFMVMYERVNKYYLDVLQPLDRDGKTVLVVAHKYIIEMFALIAAALGPEQYHDFRIPNSKPCSFAQLRTITEKNLNRVNAFSEEVESRLSGLLLGASLAGVVLKNMIGHSLPSPLFNALCLLLLAVSSFMSLMRLDRAAFVSAPTSLARIWKGITLRTLCAFGLFLLPYPAAHAAALFFLLPSAMTAPTFSFAWGGDFFLSIQSTLVMSVLAPLVIGVLAVVLGGTEFDVVSFYVVLAVTVVVPALIAQLWRRQRPIQAGAIATNWGWTGGAAMIPLALLAGFQFMPEEGLSLNRGTVTTLLVTLALFLFVRVLAAIALGLDSGDRDSNPRIKKDIYIGFIVPNIFFWFALLKSNSALPALNVIATVMFFFSIYVEEARFVAEFPKLAGLLSISRAERKLHANAGAGRRAALHVHRTAEQFSDFANPS